MEDCQVGLLVDLSEPEQRPKLFSYYSQEDEDKENSQPLTDSIEIERSGNTERRLSLTLKNSNDIQNRILRDVTEQSLTNSAKKCSSPVLRLIDDETFDFDLAVSPAARAENVSREDEDEVFFGPVGFTERLKQTFVQEVEVPPLSPLNAEQFALMVKEANYVAYRIKNSKTSSGSESSPSVGSKTSCSSIEGETTPSKRKHSRSGTFTKCQSPLELLPEEVRKVLPVIDDSKIKLPNDCQKASTLNNSENCSNEVVQRLKDDNSQKENENKNNKDGALTVKQTGRSLKAPSKLPGSKLAKPRIKYASSCESLDSKTSGHESDSNCSIASDSSDVATLKTSSKLPKQFSGKRDIPKSSRLHLPGSTINRSFNTSLNCSLNTSTNDGGVKVVPKTSRLAAPKFGGNINSKGVTPKSGAPHQQSSNSVNVKKVDPAYSVDKKQQKSAEPMKRSSPRLSAKKEAANEGPKKGGIPELKGPISKLSLLKPGEIQKRVAGSKIVTNNGPMKATQPMEALNSTIQKKTDAVVKPNINMTAAVSTPVKQDKCVKPKLLANNFSTPSTSSSTSTPVSNRRKSCLPTPQKARCSLGSIPGSPMTRRVGSSTSSRVSQLSSCSSVSESPVFNNSMTRSRIGSTTKNVGQSSSSNEVNGKSPNATKANKPRVLHTPQMPQKVQSKWSPIRRPRPISRDEEVIQCTKRKL